MKRTKLVFEITAVALILLAGIPNASDAAPAPIRNLAEWTVGPSGPIEHGLSTFSSSEGVITRTSRGGLPCMSVAKAPKSPVAYFYFILAHGTALPAGAPVYVTVQYFDDHNRYDPNNGAGDHLTIDYDSDSGTDIASHYRQANVLVGGSFTGSDAWRTVIFELDHAGFRHRQNGNADFRFEGPSMLVRSVELTATRPPQWESLAHPVLSINVRDFGAKGNAVTDDTKAFQNAMNSLYPSGGTVDVPTGNYLITGHLTIPNFVTLQGVWTIPTAWSQMKGSTLLAFEGAGKAEGQAFITLDANSTLKGITVYYPKQNPDKIVPYPWCVASAGHSLQSDGGDNASIVDCLLVNPYQGVDFGTQTSGRHYIRNLYGQPLYRGIYVSQCYDVGRIENVHFWPFWNGSKSVMDWMMANDAEAYVFGRTDWEFVFNTVALGYAIGYRFIDTPDGACNGNFTGLASDGTGIPVQIDQTQRPGLLITNGEFVAMSGKIKDQVLVTASNKGVAQFVNCSFWGPSNHIAEIAGKGSITFNACNMREWDAYGPHAAIITTGGRLTVSSCLFASNAPQLQIESGAGPTIFMGNQITGALRIDNPLNLELEQGLNATGL